MKLYQMTLFYFTFLGLILLSGCTQELENKITTLETQNAELKSTINKLDSVISALTEKEQLFAENESKLGSQIHELQLKNENIHNDLTKLKTGLEDALAEKVVLVSKLDEANESLMNTKLQLAQLQGKLDAIDREKERLAEEAANKAVLRLQLGVTMQSGETKPVTATKVYICQKRLVDIMNNMTHLRVLDSFGKTYKYSAAECWCHGKCSGPFWEDFRSASRMVEYQIEEAAKYQKATDFNGSVVFEDLMPGSYYILCATGLGGGPGVAWEYKTEIHSGNQSLSLTQRDAIDLDSLGGRIKD